MNSKDHHIFHLIKKSSLLIEVLAFISMLCMSILILNTILLIPIHFNGDSYYHLSRIFNLHGSWINFLYPQNFTTLGRVGIATNIFYPAGLLNVLVNLIPSQIGALGTYRLTVVLILYLNMLSMYVVLRYFVKTDVLKAILSAILWGSLIITFDIGTIGGEILAKTAFPFIAVGLYYFQSKKGWILLSLGILLSISSHILTTLFLLTFSVIYIIIIFFKRNADKKVIIFNGFKTTIFTLLVSLYVVVPMVVLYANNKITNPNQMASAFVDYQQVYLSGIITNPTFIIMIIIIIISIIKTQKYSLGILLSLIFTLLGTTAFIWPYILKHSFLNVIQFPYRLFNWGICLCFVFALINIVNIKISTKWNKVLTISTLLTAFFLGTAVQQSVYSKIDNDTGDIITMSKTEIVKSFENENDGQHLGEYGSFTGSLFGQKEIWSLMNYSDYSPFYSLKDHQTKFLFWDSLARHAVKHQLTDSTGNNVNTTDFSSTNATISFKSPISIDKQTIELPVFGYAGTNINVYINNKSTKYFIQNGRISINKSLTKEDSIKVVQSIPTWRIIPFIISGASMIFLIILLFPFQKIKTILSKTA